jgi:acetolactate synthase I/II/III large subunit
MRFGANVPQLTLRSLQIAKSSPPGPVYLMGAREVMESDVQPLDLKKVQPTKWKPLAPQALADEVLHTCLMISNQPRMPRPLPRLWPAQRIP